MNRKVKFKFPERVFDLLNEKKVSESDFIADFEQAEVSEYVEKITETTVDANGKIETIIKDWNIKFNKKSVLPDAFSLMG